MAYPCHPADHPDRQTDFTGSYPDANPFAAPRAPTADRRSSDAFMEIDKIGSSNPFLSNTPDWACSVENDAKKVPKNLLQISRYL